MRTIGIHTRFAWLVGAMALLVQISPALASDHKITTIGPSKSLSQNGGAAPPAVPPDAVLWSLRRLRR